VKITDLQSQKRDSSRVNVYIDEEFFCGASVDTIVKFQIYVGKIITQDEIDLFLRFELENKFLNRSLTYLSRSPKTESQIRQYLKNLAYKKKGSWYTDISIDELENIFEKIVSKLKTYKYLDDKIFAEMFVRDRVRMKPRGKQVLLMELISKGVDKEIATEVIDTLVIDEYEVLKKVYYKKYKDEKLMKEDRKKIDFLMRKGFNWDLIEKYIKDEFTE
jgi:regulatory protein